MNLWAFWAVEIGRGATEESERRFWKTTPREYRALSDQVAERERRADARFGLVASVAANLLGGKRGGGQFQPADFFPSLSSGPQPIRRGASDDEVVAGWEAWAALARAKAS